MGELREIRPSTILCPTCQGEGLLVCSECDGTGNTIDEDDIEKAIIFCTLCDGDGTLECGSCGGDGTVEAEDTYDQLTFTETEGDIING